MKKILLAASVILILASCSQTKKWTDTEREKVRKVVSEHREKGALRHMALENYNNIEECVITTIEEVYPDYGSYSKLASQNDTIIGVMIGCTGDLLGPNYENISMIFPVDQLKAIGILSMQISAEQITAFYISLASQLSNIYPTPYVFMEAIIKDSAAANNLVILMQTCAAVVMAEPVAPAAK